VSDEMPKSHLDYYRMAKSYGASGRYEEAIEAYEKAIELKRDYAHAWYYKAQLHYRLKEYDQAVCCAETALKLEPSWNHHVQRILREAKLRLDA